MNRRIISEILHGKWLIEKQWADAHLPLVVSLLNGNTNLSFVERTSNQGIEMPFGINPSTMERFDIKKYDYNQGKYVPNPNMPPNTVGVLHGAFGLI